MLPAFPVYCLRMLRTTTLAATVVAALFGCAYPRTIHVYDEECQIMSRKMVLDLADVGPHRCASDCIAELVGQTAILAASTVISGSIVVTGNVVYWLEKKRDCRPRPSAAQNADEAE